MTDTEKPKRKRYARRMPSQPVPEGIERDPCMVFPEHRFGKVPSKPVGGCFCAVCAKRREIRNLDRIKKRRIVQYKKNAHSRLVKLAFLKKYLQQDLETVEAEIEVAKQFTKKTQHRLVLEWLPRVQY